jgi:hypothetical protein
MPPHLWRCAGLRGHGGRLGRCRLAETLGLVPTGRPQEAAAEEIAVRAADHLAFHHFQAVDVPLDRAGAPGQCHARCDGGIVIAEPTGKALHGLQRTRARPLQPRIEVLGLPLAHELEKVLREVDGLGDLGSLRVELGELLRLGLRTLRGTPQHQPGRPTGRQRGAHGFGHAWEGPPRAALARGESLGLA